MLIQRLSWCMSSVLLSALLLGAVDHARAREPMPDRLNLESQLLEHSKILLTKINGAGAKYIGVLKFLARHESTKTFSNSMGRLHQRLAEKEEITLVFASNSRPAAPIVVIRSASDTASRIHGANHLNRKDDRALDLLFQQKYQLAWKENEVSEAEPDAFIYGVAELADSLQTIDIQLHAVLRSGLSFQPGASQRRIIGDRFTARLDLDELMSAGESYCAPAAGNDSENKLAYDSARACRADLSKHPLKDPTRPIDIEICYGDKPATIDFRSEDPNHVGAFIDEPHEQQTVKVILKRRNSADTNRYGVLLRVNGWNTIGKQNLPDAQCAIWILEPDKPLMLVDGFQITHGNDGKREPFRVAARSENKALEDLYGQDVGLISIAVFNECRDSAQEIEEDANEHKYTQLFAIKKLALPQTTAASRSSLGESLSDELYQQFEKGIISYDAATVSKPTKQVDFRRASMPLFATTIRYYNKAK